jgi:hypothetical protein
MTELQKEFEATGYTSWINADLYPDGNIYTQEYTQWLERQVLALRQPPVSGRCFNEYDMKKAFNEGQKEWSNNKDFDVLINTYR